MLPAGTLRALKGHHDAIVIVVLAALSAACGAATSPWAGVTGLAVAGTLYHVRCVSAERHRRAKAMLDWERKLQETAAIRSRYRRKPSLNPSPDRTLRNKGVSHDR